MSFKDELAKVLQNLSGKSVPTAPTTSRMLHAFNLLYLCVVTFTLATTDATLVVKKGTEVVVPEEDGTYALTEGAYMYSVTKPKYTGLIDVALTISNTDETNGTKAVSVAALKTCVVTFTKTPADLTLVVKQGATVIVAEANGTYLLPAGAYTYTASKEGYTSAVDTALTISAGDETTGTKTVVVTIGET